MAGKDRVLSLNAQLHFSWIPTMSQRSLAVPSFDPYFGSNTPLPPAKNIAVWERGIATLLYIFLHTKGTWGSRFSMYLQGIGLGPLVLSLYYLSGHLSPIYNVICHQKASMNMKILLFPSHLSFYRLSSQLQIPYALHDIYVQVDGSQRIGSKEDLSSRNDYISRQFCSFRLLKFRYLLNLFPSWCRGKVSKRVAFDAYTYETYNHMKWTHNKGLHSEYEGDFSGNFHIYTGKGRHFTHKIPTPTLSYAPYMLTYVWGTPKGMCRGTFVCRVP